MWGVARVGHPRTMSGRGTPCLAALPPTLAVLLAMLDGPVALDDVGRFACRLAARLDERPDRLALGIVQLEVSHPGHDAGGDIATTAEPLPAAGPAPRWWRR
jgi:hypothetical protein